MSDSILTRLIGTTRDLFRIGNRKIQNNAGTLEFRDLNDSLSNIKVAGIQILDGNQADGYVLTSDANGNAAWEANAGGGGGSSYYQTIQDDGTALTQRAALNLVAGNNVVLDVQDDSGNDRTTVIIGADTSGSGGGAGVQYEWEPGEVTAGTGANFGSGNPYSEVRGTVIFYRPFRATAITVNVSDPGDFAVYMDGHEIWSGTSLSSGDGQRFDLNSEIIIFPGMHTLRWVKTDSEAQLRGNSGDQSDDYVYMPENTGAYYRASNGATTTGYTPAVQFHGEVGSVAAIAAQDQILAVQNATVLIEEIEITANTPEVLFENIPADYDHLILEIYGNTDRGATRDGIRFQFGTGGVLDTGGNYMYANYEYAGGGSSGSTTGAGSVTTGRTMTASGSPSGMVGYVHLTIYDYARTGFNTPFYWHGTGNAGRDVGSGQWRNSVDPVDTISIVPQDGFNFTAGVMRLYGHSKLKETGTTISTNPAQIYTVSGESGEASGGAMRKVVYQDPDDGSWKIASNKLDGSNSLLLSSRIGLSAETIPASGVFEVQTSGVMSGFSWNVADVGKSVWLGESGDLTLTKPSPQSYGEQVATIRVGIVESTNSIYICPSSDIVFSLLDLPPSNDTQSYSIKHLEDIIPFQREVEVYRKTLNIVSEHDITQSSALTVTASGVGYGQGVENLTDESQYTYWQSQSGFPVYLEFEYSISFTLSSFTFKAYTTYFDYHPKRFSLQYWDGSAWVDVAYFDEEGNGWSSGEERTYTYYGLKESTKWRINFTASFREGVGSFEEEVVLAEIMINQLAASSSHPHWERYEGDIDIDYLNSAINLDLTNAIGREYLISVSQPVISTDQINADIEINDGVNTQQAIFTYAGEIAVSTGKIRIYNTSAKTRNIVKVFLSVSTPPIGATDTLIDVNKDGTSIFTTQGNRPALISGEYTGESDDIDTPSWLPGEYLTFDVDQVSETPPEDLTVHIVYE